MKWIEILRKDKYALLQSESDTQYAVVSGYDPMQPEGQQWSSGTCDRFCCRFVFNKNFCMYFVTLVNIFHANLKVIQFN